MVKKVVSVQVPNVCASLLRLKYAKEDVDGHLLLSIFFFSIEGRKGN